MARVTIDPHMFGEQWFGPIAQALLDHPNVTFSYCRLSKETSELERKVAALKFFKLAGEKKKREDANERSVKAFHAEILSNVHWNAKKALCDDAHFFALQRALPTPYVFSLDKRMAGCRDCLSGKIDRGFLGFIVIGKESIYNKHRAWILS